MADVDMRIGHGYDVHRMVEGRKLILGGVDIPFSMGLLGHSDADVLTHALMDAMLGACSAGDIGHLFPDDDEDYLGANSLKLLSEVVKVIGKKGWQLSNCDITVICEKPKLAEYLDEMKKNISDVIGTSRDAVSIKATTTEKLGFAGRGEGIAVEAVCLLKRKEG